MSLAEIVKKTPNKENRKHINKTLTHEEFVNLSKSIHGENSFTYKSKYVNTRVYFTLLCNICNHEYSSRYYNHIVRKDTCSKCSMNAKIERLRKENEKKFIEKSKIIFKDYNYDYVVYTYYNKEVIIKCDKNHTFRILPYKHLSGIGCEICLRELKRDGKISFDSNKFVEVKKRKKIKKWTTELFIEESKKIFGDIYDYSLVEYVNLETHVKIICDKGHIFEQQPRCHLAKSGCKECALKEWTDKLKLNNEEFIERSKERFGKDTFDYSLVDYKSSRDYVTLICKDKNHKFNVKAGKHLFSLGCPLCKNTSELKLFDKLRKIYNNLSFQKYFKENNEIKTYPFDFCLEEFKVIIELDGDQHFRKIEYFKDSNIEERQRVDFLKMFEVSKLGYSIIRIYQPNILLTKFNWLNLICESINFIIENNKPCVVTIEKEKKVYNTYIDNYKKFILSKNLVFDDTYYLSIELSEKNDIYFNINFSDVDLDDYYVPDEDDF